MIQLRDLEARLDAAADQLTSCPTLRTAAELSDEDFHSVLVQRRFLSLAFTAFYDSIIDALDDREMRTVCRQILREEYPGQDGNTASHRESLVQDLVELGIPKQRLRTAIPTQITSHAIIATLELVPAASLEAHSQVGVATTAACYAESLVAAEYMALKPRIEKRLRLDENGESVFYGPHLRHDSGHTTRLLQAVCILMCRDGEQMDAFDAAVARSLQVRLDFYRQFERSPGGRNPQDRQPSKPGAG